MAEKKRKYARSSKTLAATPKFLTFLDKLIAQREALKASDYILMTEKKRKYVDVRFTSRERKDPQTGRFYSWSWTIDAATVHEQVRAAQKRWPDVDVRITAHD